MSYLSPPVANAVRRTITRLEANNPNDPKITESSSRFIEHFLEALSLALCYKTQDPPNPITRAALQHSVQDLLAEIQAPAS